jgi:hypothetical protein
MSRACAGCLLWLLSHLHAYSVRHVYINSCTVFSGTGYVVLGSWYGAGRWFSETVAKDSRPAKYLNGLIHGKQDGERTRQHSYARCRFA